VTDSTNAKRQRPASISSNLLQFMYCDACFEATHELYLILKLIKKAIFCS